MKRRRRPAARSPAAPQAEAASPSVAQSQAEPASRRQWLHGILEYGMVGTLTSRVIDAAFVALILVSVTAVVLESVPDLAARYGGVFFAIEIVSLVVFTLEYVFRLWIAGAHDADVGASPWRSPLAYAASFGGIVDLLAVLPFWVALFLPFDLRVIMVFRVFRFLKLARHSVGVRSLLDALYVERGPLLGCLMIFAGTSVVMGAMMYLAERDVQPDKLGTIPLAMWWAVTTLGTTGYGDVVPVTLVGRLINAATIMCALMMIALPVGLVATAFADQIHKRDFVVTWGMVARVPLFAGLSAGDIANIMRLLSSASYAAGETIVREGDSADSMFFIASGEVEIALKEGAQRMGVGHFFGEVGVLKKSSRSATVTALSRTSLLVLNADDLHNLMQKDERIAQAMRKVTTERLGHELVTKDGDIVEDEVEDKAKEEKRPEGDRG